MALDETYTPQRGKSHCRALAAAKATNPEAKVTLLTIAAGYERLAERAMEHDTVEHEE